MRPANNTHVLIEQPTKQTYSLSFSDSFNDSSIEYKFFDTQSDIKNDNQLNMSYYRNQPARAAKIAAKVKMKAAMIPCKIHFSISLVMIC